MSFGVGDLVECVDDVPLPGKSWVGDRPRRGAVYTVSGFGFSPPEMNEPVVWLREIRNYSRFYSADIGFLASRFRPFRSKHVEELRKIVADVFDGEKIFADGVSETGHLDRAPHVPATPAHTDSVPSIIRPDPVPSTEHTGCDRDLTGVRG